VRYDQNPAWELSQPGFVVSAASRPSTAYRSYQFRHFT
jgi:hypothetical protein